MTQQNDTVGVDDFFDDIGGTGAPTAKLSDINDGVVGVIESQRVVDFVPFGKKDPEILDNGKTRKQLIVILKTDLRNWAGLKEAPLIDREDASKGTRPPGDDDGRRAVYIPQYKNIQYAVRDAVIASGAYGGKNGPLRDGARFGVKVVDLEDTNQGNPKKVHKAFYEAVAASAELFPTEEPAAPAPEATQAPVPDQAAPTQSAAPVDPWSRKAASTPSEPPF